MIPALETGTFYKTCLLDHLDGIRSAGYELIEVWCYEPHFYYQSSSFVKEASGRIGTSGLKVHSLHVIFHGVHDLSNADECDRVHALETAKRQAEICALLGGGIIVVHPGCEVSRDEERSPRMAYFLESLTALSNFCRGIGVKIAVENLAPAYFGGRFEEIERILREFDNGVVGLCLDTSHAFMAGDLCRYLDALGGRISTFHISDSLGRHDDHLPPGRGKIDWSGFMRKVDQIGYEGPLTIEVLRGSDDLYELIRTARNNINEYRELSVVG
jgi:sugar phosphate isomerase/epimerase